MYNHLSLLNLLSLLQDFDRIVLDEAVLGVARMYFIPYTLIMYFIPYTLMIKFTTCFPMVGGCPGTLASSTTKTGRHDIAEIMLKVALKHQK